MSSKVFVMLSGGVDSSVVAARLVEAGYDVVGVYMKNWSPERITNPVVRKMLQDCSSDEDIIYAKATAEALNIPFKEVNFEQEYWNEIIEPFFDGIAKGAMPNPDIWCNQFVKYGVFLDWALAQGADFVASGHYARLGKTVSSSKYQVASKSENVKILNTYYLLPATKDVTLLRGVDPAKDQSYFLSQVPKEKLQYAMFPIGHMFKSQVRAEALARGLPTATRPDSQGICFVGKVPIKEFLKERFQEKKGDVVIKDKTKIGEHDGAWFYTIGERLGFHQNQKEKTKNQNNKLKLTNIFGDDKKPLYIVEKDIKRNILVVGEDDGSEPLWKKEISANNWNFFETPRANEVYDVEIRYHQQPKSRGKILNLKSNILNLSLQEPVRAITLGQTVVLSKGDQIIGSGIISSQ